MSNSLKNFDGHLEAKKGKNRHFYGLEASILPIQFIFDIEKIIISGTRLYLDHI